MHGLLLLNIEFILYIYISSAITYFVVTVLVKLYKMKNKGVKLREKNMGAIIKVIIKQKENLEWEGFLR